MTFIISTMPAQVFAFVTKPNNILFGFKSQETQLFAFGLVRISERKKTLVSNPFDFALGWV